MQSLVSVPSSSHLHLWSLPDGTGLHAPLGELAVEDGALRLCCHLCGCWYVSLGAHVKAHGYTADAYRREMGLCATVPLTSASLSARIARRQSNQYRRDPEVRARLGAGREALRPTPAPTASPSSVEPVQRLRRRAAAQAAGRRTMAVRREQELAQRVAQWGHDALHDFLRCAYSDGASLDDLALQTGLGRARLRQEMTAAGIQTRAVGRNSADGKRSRALKHDAAAARRVGTDDITTWLTEHSRDGWSVRRMAAAVGHSSPWVKARLTTVRAMPPSTTTPWGIAH